MWSSASPVVSEVSRCFICREQDVYGGPSFLIPASCLNFHMTNSPLSAASQKDLMKDGKLILTIMPHPNLPSTESQSDVSKNWEREIYLLFQMPSLGLSPGSGHQSKRVLLLTHS